MGIRFTFSRPSRARATAATAALVLSVPAALVACDTAPPPPKAAPRCEPTPEAQIPVIALAADAAGPDTCPRPGDAKDGRWDVAPVFPEEPGERLPASMKRLCVYTWSGCGAPETAALPLAQLTFAADDPPIVAPLAAADKAASDGVRAARGRLARAADALSPLPAAAGATPVFIGVPDTSGAPPKGGDDIAIEAASHGFDVAWIARYLACPRGALQTCLARVRTDLALSRPGGRGTRAELAASVVRLVRGWKKEGRSAPLVIPIAAGWEPVAERAIPWRKGPPASDSAPDSLPAPPVSAGADSASPSPAAPLSPASRAVLDALHYAACHGALVIAAAGNDPGYKDAPSGVMLPAAWESLPAPSAAACKGWFGDDAAARLAAPTAVYTPLLHAVGGVDDRDHPIPGTRARGLPRLVAPASLVAAFPDDPADAGYSRICAPGADTPSAFVCDRTTPRTGSSMAAAVAAGVAAVVWAHHPSWSAHDVMSAVYTGGVALGEKADVSLSGPGKETIVRLSLCGALAASCKGAPKGTCPERLTCNKPPAFAKGTRPSPFVTARSGLLPLSVAATPFDPALVCPGCLFHTGQVRADGCELIGQVPGGLFETAHIGPVREPTLDLYDANGRRLGYVETPGFKPQVWSAAERGDQPLYADAASCSGAAQVVLRWVACDDAACARPIPMFREVPVVP